MYYEYVHDMYVHDMYENIHDMYVDDIYTIDNEYIRDVYSFKTRCVHTRYVL